jgi:tRNA threonylcarbamoyladenosine biosynthesis protein TsaE
VDARIDLVTGAVEDTRAVGRAVAGILVAGDLVALAGDLGAGKTAFIQGAAAGLGVTDAVVSPTFTLVREYEGNLPVVHIDVYRLERIREVLDLGFEDYLEDGRVVFVEWGDVVQGLLPESRMEVQLTLPSDEDRDQSRRRIVLEGRGEAWGPRWDELVRATDRWKAA